VNSGAPNGKQFLLLLEAVGALWTLSFDEQNRAEMINNPDSKVIDTLYKCHKAENEEVRKICYKALWTMRDHLKSSGISK
jgi:hypothetical protein